MHKAHLGLLVLLLLPLQTFSQNADSLRLSRIDSELSALVGRDSTFRREVDVTSGRLSLSELLRSVLSNHNEFITLWEEKDVSVRSVEKIPVSCNFRRARVDDLVRFLCREYRLDVAASGNILSIFPAAAPTVPAPDPDVAYAAADTTLSYDLRGERLIDVAKKIARLSARNVIVPEPLYDCKVSGYVRRMPFDEALRTLAARPVERRTVVRREVGVVGGPSGGLLPVRLLRIGSVTLRTRATLDAFRRSLHRAHALVASESREHRGRVIFLIFHLSIRLVGTSGLRNRTPAVPGPARTTGAASAATFGLSGGKGNPFFRITAYCRPDLAIKDRGRYKFAAFALSLHP